MNPEVTIALISSGSSLAVAAVSIIMNNRVLGFKVDELKEDFDRLEKKVEKHNNLVERTAVIERDLKTNWNRVDELRSEVRDLRDK